RNSILIVDVVLDRDFSEAHELADVVDLSVRVLGIHQLGAEQDYSVQAGYSQERYNNFRPVFGKFFNYPVVGKLVFEEFELDCVGKLEEEFLEAVEAIKLNCAGGGPEVPV